LKLSLELRDIIYKMLLTTPYCTDLARQEILSTPYGTNIESGRRFWKFHLHTDILLVNKQISAEATRILYQGNDFVLLKIVGISLWLGWVPAFAYLPENKITSPVLRIEFSVDDVSDVEDDLSNIEDDISDVENDVTHVEEDATHVEDDAAHVEDDAAHVEDDASHFEDSISHVEDDDSQSLLTTSEGLKSIIEVLWSLGDANSGSIHFQMLRLTLDFNLKAASQYRVLSELLIRPWETISRHRACTGW
jgi:hypothetical protein